MRYQPERALTHCITHRCENSCDNGRNEVSAREGIDTHSFRMLHLWHIYPCRNEVSAREGIDTHDVLPSFQLMFQNQVEMRYQPERALTLYFANARV